MILTPMQFTQLNYTSENYKIHQKSSSQSTVARIHGLADRFLRCGVSTYLGGRIVWRTYPEGANYSIRRAGRVTAGQAREPEARLITCLANQEEEVQAEA